MVLQIIREKSCPFYLKIRVHGKDELAAVFVHAHGNVLLVVLLHRDNFKHVALYKTRKSVKISFQRKKKTKNKVKKRKKKKINIFYLRIAINLCFCAETPQVHSSACDT